MPGDLGRHILNTWYCQFHRNLQNNEYRVRTETCQEVMTTETKINRLLTVIKIIFFSSFCPFESHALYSKQQDHSIQKIP